MNRITVSYGSGEIRWTNNPWRRVLLVGYAKFCHKVLDDSNKNLWTDEFCREVRGILNKLTTENYMKLLNQIKQLPIRSESQLKGFARLVFEKAVTEHLFTDSYALLCTEMALLRVTTDDSTPEKPQEINFRKCIINFCQEEFELLLGHTNWNENTHTLYHSNEFDRIRRMRFIGVCKFVGHLFKQNMLTVNIVMKVMKSLMDNKSEGSMECFSTLVTVIGETLEQKGVDYMCKYYSDIEDLVAKKDNKICNRVRFKLMDMIDLKNAKWIPTNRKSKQDILGLRPTSVYEKRKIKKKQSTITSQKPTLQPPENLHIEMPHNCTKTVKESKPMREKVVSDSMNQFDIHGRAIEFKLRSLDNDQRRLAEKLIYNVLFEAEAGKLTMERVENWK